VIASPSEKLTFFDFLGGGFIGSLGPDRVFVGNGSNKRLLGYTMAICAEYQPLSFALSSVKKSSSETRFFCTIGMNGKLLWRIYTALTHLWSC
jgi:hypothetical protein